MSNSKDESRSVVNSVPAVDEELHGSPGVVLTAKRGPEHGAAVLEPNALNATPFTPTSEDMAHKPSISVVTPLADARSKVVKERLQQVIDHPDADQYSDVAGVVLSRDGRSFVYYSAGYNRVMLMGALQDLLYSLAKEGDR